MRRKRGFTLVEMLVACILITLVTGTAFAVLGGGLRVWERLREHGDSEQSAMLGLSRLRRDIEGTRRFRLLPFEGKYEQVSFAAILPADDELLEGELGRITYYADGRNKQLCRSAQPFRALKRVRATHACSAVLENVSRVRFRYLAHDPESGAFDWKQRWSSDQPPVALKLEVEEEGKRGVRILTFALPVARPRAEGAPH